MTRSCTEHVRSQYHPKPLLMGKQRNTEIEGTFDNTIWYKNGKKFLVRAKGNTGKQGKEAKIQASLLGQASALSARIRKGLAPVLPEPGNRKMMYALNYALQQWLRTGQHQSDNPASNLPFIHGFVFHRNDSTGENYLSLQVSRTAGGLLLHIPPFDSPNPIHPLPFSGTVELRIAAVSCSLADKAATRTWDSTLTITYNGTPLPAREIFIPLESLPGCLTVVALSVNGMTSVVVGSEWE